MAFDPIARGPSAFRQMVRAEQAVEKGEVNREIHVGRFLFDAVMPVVKAGNYEDLFDEAEASPNIKVE